MIRTMVIISLVVLSLVFPKPVYSTEVYICNWYDYGYDCILIADPPININEDYDM